MASFRPLLIGALVLTEVGIWQWRMVIAHRGRRGYAMLLGFVGALLQITAISQVVSDIHDLLSVAAYAGGVGCGVALGIVAGERLTPGRLEVTVVTSRPGLAQHLWNDGWAVTAHEAQDRDGPVVAIRVDLDPRDEGRLRHAILRIDPQAKLTTKEVTSMISSPRRARREARRTVHCVLEQRRADSVH